MTIDDLIKEAHQTAIDHGWWEGGERSAGDQFANFHAEISEAWEEWRKFGWKQEAMLYTDIVHHEEHGEDACDIFVCDNTHKPEGIAAEFADVMIRMFDTCAKYDIPLEKALQLKMAFNKTRAHRHGGKLA